MNPSDTTDPDEVLAYSLQIQDAVEQAADDRALLARVEDFAGGPDQLIAFLAEGMALAFAPERSAGETGLVQFVVRLPDQDVHIWMTVDADGCRTSDTGDDPDAVIWLDLAVFLRIAFKRTEGADAYIAGQIEVVGDVVLATSLDDWFDSPVLAVRQTVA